MKKIAKLIMFALALSLMFTGCGNKEGEVEGSTKKIEEIASKSKVVKLLSGDYYMKYKMITESQEVTAEITRKGEKAASSSDMMGQIARTINDDEYIYTILDSQKMIIKDKVNVANAENSDFGPNKEFDIKEGTTFTTGEETIGSIKYYFEDFAGSKFYFDRDKLKIINTEGIRLDVVECESKAKDSLFDIPKDYKEMPTLVEDGMGTTGNAFSGPGNIMTGASSDYSVNIPSEYLN